MTVIALLNTENDPHVVADTLLSAQGADLRSIKTVWMPSLGQVSSAIGTEEDPWHIVRLARKTFFLPNYSGVLAFSGDCRAAFAFWSELSQIILSSGGYQPDMRVDSNMIDLAIQRSDSARFSLLGLIKNAQGKWDVFTHNKHEVVNTKNFGTCYLAGSGVELLATKLKQQDDIEQPIRPGVLRRIGPTESLAEGISADLLYAESDAQNGLNNAATYACGGFYEWYRVEGHGVGMPHTRMDIHITAIDGQPVITRLYLVELLQRKETQIDPFPATNYSIVVMSVALETTTPIECDKGTWLIKAPHPHAVLIESTFELYSSEQDDGRFSGPMSAEVLKDFFEQPEAVKRIRLICSGNDLARTRSISRLSDEEEVLATLSYRDGQLEVSLGAGVCEVAKDMLHD